MPSSNSVRKRVRHEKTSSSDFDSSVAAFSVCSQLLLASRSHEHQLRELLGLQHLTGDCNFDVHDPVHTLYRDAANSIIWGDGTSGTQYLSFTPVPGSTQLSATIYATIPAGLDVAPGTYTDTIQATLNWGTGSSNRFFTVTATVGSECTVSSSSVNFGAYDPVSANATTPRDSTGTVNVYCTPGTLATVALDLGTHASGSTRRMLAGADLLTYEIYRDSTRTVVWNTTNTNSGTSTSKNTPINSGFIAYGRIPAGQDVTIGSYSDTVLVTVNY